MRGGSQRVTDLGRLGAIRTRFCTETTLRFGLTPFDLAQTTLGLIKPAPVARQCKTAPPPREIHRGTLGKYQGGVPKTPRYPYALARGGMPGPRRNPQARAGTGRFRANNL